MDADGGQDFEIPGDLDLVFPTGSVNGETECIIISIIDDDNFEGFHSFEVDIEEINPPVITVAAGVGVVTISDEDGKLRMYARQVFGANKCNVNGALQLLHVFILLV